MKEKFNLLIKSCGTRTVPAAETKSIGLPAGPAFGVGRHSVVMVFACPLDNSLFRYCKKLLKTNNLFAKTIS